MFALQHFRTIGDVNGMKKHSRFNRYITQKLSSLFRTTQTAFGVNQNQQDSIRLRPLCYKWLQLFTYRNVIVIIDCIVFYILWITDYLYL